MEQITLFSILATALVIVVGIVAAFVAGTRLGPRPVRRRTPADRETWTSDGLHPLQLDVLTAMRRPLVVVDRHSEAAFSATQAQALGLVRDGVLVHPELRALVLEEFRRSTAESRPGAPASTAAPLEVETVLPRGPLGEGRLYVSVRLSRLGRDLVVLDVEDRSESRRVDEIRRDFVVNVSHELKTPVGAISLLAETMGDAADDPVAVRRFAERMRRESTRLASLVTDIIELSRVQYVDGLEDADLVDLDAVVHDAVDQVRWRAEEEQITLVLGGNVGAQAHGDRDLLTTAVRNLLVNAIAYSPHDTRVSVAVRRHEGLVEVLVTDRGIGIPVEEQSRIFERFYRADPARSRQTGGTGLGLAIVRHVAENHGGDVSVWSRPGQGSTFTIRLPDALPTTTADPAPDVDAPGGAP